MKVMLVDDHTLFREGLAEILGHAGDVEIVGSTGRADEALELAAAALPDIVLIDLDLPDGDIPAHIKQFSLRYPEVHIIVLSAHISDEALVTVIENGARGYLLKSAGKQELLASLRAVMNHEAALSRKLVRKMIDNLAIKGRAGRTDQRRVELLSLREREVFELVREGASNQEIAMRLSISENTVKAHMHKIFEKLGVRNRREARAYGSKTHPPA